VSEASGDLSSFKLAGKETNLETQHLFVEILGRTSTKGLHVVQQKEATVGPVLLRWQLLWERGIWNVSRGMHMVWEGDCLRWGRTLASFLWKQRWAALDFVYPRLL